MSDERIQHVPYTSYCIEQKIVDALWMLLNFCNTEQIFSIRYCYLMSTPVSSDIGHKIKIPNQKERKKKLSFF